MLRFLIERINFLHKAVGIADVSRLLCLSSEVERTNHNESVNNASQTKRKWGSIFLHRCAYCRPASFVNGLRHAQLGVESGIADLPVEDWKPVAIIPSG
jgi:hypothetical protein